jgi:hypothetical protein
VLIEQGQLDYAMLVAADHQHFRRLLARQVRHHLAKRRRRSIVDNLLDRCKELVCSKPFRIKAQRRGWCYTLDGKPADSKSPRSADLKEIAGRLTRFPHAKSNPVIRAPMIYTTDTLADLLKTVAEASPHWVTMRDLHSVFSILLTSWLPSFLENTEGRSDRAEVRELDAEEESMATEATHWIVANSTADQLELLGLKLAGNPDSSIASRYRVSRPTVMRRKGEALRILRDALAGHPDRVREEVMNRLGARLVRKAVENDGE